MFTKLKLLLTFIAFSSIFPHSLQAQGTCDFSIDAQVTEVDCLANGIIEVILNGPDLADMDDFLYRVYPQGDNPDNYDLVKENIFTGLSEGIYTVEATGFCKRNGVRKEKSQTDVNVSRSQQYEKPDFTIDSNFTESQINASRHTLSCLPTGALRIQNIRASKFPITIRLSKYPPEYTGNLVMLDNAYSHAPEYTFENLPEGTYEIEILDDCGGAQKRTETIQTLSIDVPRLFSDRMSFMLEEDNCVGFSVDRNYDFDPEYAFYITNRAKHFEFAQYYPGDDLDNLVWENFSSRSYPTLTSIKTRYTLKEMRDDHSKIPQLVTRVKGGSCSARDITTLRTHEIDFKYLEGIHFQNPGSVTNTCFPYDYTVFIPTWILEYAVCFPYSWTVERADNWNQSDYKLIKSGSNTEAGERIIVEPAVVNSWYKITITDASGAQYESAEWISQKLPTLGVIVSSLPKPCREEVEFTIMAAPGTTVIFDEAGSSPHITPPNQRSITIPLEDYPDVTKLVHVYPYNDADWSVPMTVPSSYMPVGQYVSYKAVDQCGNVSVRGGFNENPEVQFSDRIPTINIEYICDKARITSPDLAGIISTYDPVTGQSTDIPTYLGVDYFEAPDGANITYSSNAPACVSSEDPSQYVEVYKSGRYKMILSNKFDGINYTDPQWTCQKTFWIDINISEMKVEQGTSAAYRCPGATVGTGYIKLKMVGGSGNYEFTLFARGDNTTPLATSTTGEFTSWNYAATDLYDVRIEDLTCGQTLKHEVSVYNLSNATVGWPEGYVYRKCEGEQLKLYSLALGETTYSWTGPNGWSSTEQNPTIPILDSNNSGTYTVEVGIPGCGPGETVKGSFVISVADKVMYWNPNASNNNWYDTDNWLTADGDIAASVPAPCTTVHIAGNSTMYPNLDKDVTPRAIFGFPACDNIIFHYGSEAIYPHYLQYNKAFVQYNFNYYGSYALNSQPTSSFDENSYPLATWGDEIPAMQRSRWYMISAPLKHITGGDFGLAGYPNTYQRLYNAYNPETGKPAKDDFSGSFNTQNISLENTAHAMALWVPDYDPLYVGLGDHKYLENLKGIMEMPYFQNPEIMANRPLHKYDETTSTSSFQYYEYKLPTLDPYDQYDQYIRESDAYRFVYETNGDKAEEFYINGNMVAGYALTLPPAYASFRLMIGNPLMCHIDFDKFYAANRGTIKDFYMVMDGASETFQTYRVGAGSADGLTNQIPPMQAFIVTMEEAPIDYRVYFPFEGPDAVITPNSSGDALPKPRASKAEENSGHLTISASTPQKTGLVSTKDRVKTNATLRVNEPYTNIPKVVFPDGLSKKAEVFLIDENGNLNAEQITTTYPEVVKLGVESLYKEDITLNFSKEKNSVIDKAILVDKHLKTSVDVTEDGAYVFKHRYNEKNGLDDNRFELRLTYNVSGIAENEQNAVIVHANQKGLTVESLQDISSVILYNSLGQVLISDKDLNTRTYLNETAIIPGVYVVNVILANDFKPTTQKIIIR